MVYILLANKLYKYKNRRSRVIYIGTTGKGGATARNFGRRQGKSSLL